LFLGTWLVLQAQRLLSGLRLPLVIAVWALMFVGLAAAFVFNYAVLPHFDDRYRAVFYPGPTLAREISQRYTAATGRPLRYVIPTMWNGGNLAHSAPTRPRVLIDGEPARAPWIDLDDLRASGAAVVWTFGDRDSVPAPFREIAGDAAVQAPFRLDYQRGGATLDVGWAIRPPKPATPAK